MSVDILQFSRKFNYECDSCGISSIITYIKEIKKADVVLYGAGDVGYQQLFWFRRRGIEPLCVIDIKADGSKKEFFDCSLIHPHNLKKSIISKNVIAVIATTAYDCSIDREEISRVLIKAGINDVFYFHLQNFYYGMWAKYYAENRNEIQMFIKCLGDKESKVTMTEYVRCIMQDDYYRGKHIASREKYIMDENFVWLENESIINCGMGLGDTIFHISASKQFDRIYGIESSATMFRHAKSLLLLLPLSIQKKIELTNVEIANEATSIDSLFSKKTVSLICLDVEGSELELLRSAEVLIKKQDPVLAISLYHKKEDVGKRQIGSHLLKNARKM